MMDAWSWSWRAHIFLLLWNPLRIHISIYEYSRWWFMIFWILSQNMFEVVLEFPISFVMAHVSYCLKYLLKNRLKCLLSWPFYAFYNFETIFLGDYLLDLTFCGCHTWLFLHSLFVRLKTTKNVCTPVLSIENNITWQCFVNLTNILVNQKLEILDQPIQW